MTTPTDRVPTDQDPQVFEAAPAADTEHVGSLPRDLYAESELELRHERTERFIRQAEQLA